MKLIFWKIGAGNFVARIRQTLHTVIIGSIGVILIFSTYFVLSSISYSKSQWEKKHFGVIGTEISPRFGHELTESQIDRIRSQLQAAGIASLPYMSGHEAAVTVREAAEESGLTGFRGTMQTQGTVILSEKLARQLFGVTEAGAHGILLATDNLYSSLPGSSFFTDLIERPIKKEALSHMSMVESIFTPPFLFFVAVSLFADMLLLVQLFNILKERRKYYLGVLRSLGVGSRDCFVVNANECALLCASITVAGVGIGIPLGYGLLAVNATYIGQLLDRYSAYA